MVEKYLIKEVDLVADSVRKAQYYLCLYLLGHGQGYKITKESGPFGHRKVTESWHRDTLDEADKKYEGIIRLKTTRIKGRRYRIDEEPGKDPQLPLL